MHKLGGDDYMGTMCNLNLINYFKGKFKLHIHERCGQLHYSNDSNR
jgi:hypothetical protein